MQKMLGRAVALTSLLGGLTLGAMAQTSPALNPGDIALVGWIDNGSPDAYAFVALVDIPATTAIYFTDNGWTGTQYRGASATDGDGNENLMKWQALNDIGAGRVICTTDTSVDFIWTTSGSIPGTTSGSFLPLSLSTSGDQIYAFQGPESNPLFSPSVHLYVLDDTGAFEAATNSNQGDVPPGLSTAAHTAVTYAQSSAGQNFMGFNTGTLTNGTKTQWLEAIDNSANWTFGASGTMACGTTITVDDECTPPAVLVDPISQTACPGDLIILTVSASGSSPLNYQWRKDTIDIGGETSDTLTIASYSGGDAGSYDCVVTNDCGSDTSAAAVLSSGAAPSVTGDPVGKTVGDGGGVILSVTATGDEPLGYQWRKDGSDIGGETSATLNLPTVQSGDAGAYDCVVTNNCGSDTSAAATITVVSQTTIDPGCVALIGWVDNGSPNDIFTMVALGDLPTGTVLLFTDNGWTGTQYRSPDAGDGDGNESLLKWSAHADIPKGTIISSTDTSADYTWTSFGLIVDTTSGSFGPVALSQTGDQIYIIQGPASNPLLNVSNHIFVLDDTGAFEPATNSNEGDVSPGLSVAGDTAVTFTRNVSGENFMGFNTGVLSSGTKTDWLDAINNEANWTFGASGTLPSGTITVTGTECEGVTCVPCDVNCDGSVNGFDIDPFVGLLSGSGSPCAPCAGDVNNDGSVNGFDIDPFVAALSGDPC